MRLDDLELLRLQPPRLEQDRVRDRDLADVVQRRRLAHQRHDPVALAQLARHPRREGADALGVLGRVVVTVLGGQRQPVQGVDARCLRVPERREHLAGDDRLELLQAHAHLAVLEHQPQPANRGRAERLSLGLQLRHRHHGRPGVEPEGVQARAHRLRIGVAEAEHDLRLRGHRLGGDQLQRGNEIDRRAARRGQLGAKGLRRIAIPADNQNAGAGEAVVIHTQT